MEPRIEMIAHNLQRHWVALAGVAVAALMGGGLGKALTPQGLYREPQAAQLIADPVEPQADITPVAYPNRMPDYVFGTDAVRAQSEAAFIPTSYTIPDAYTPAPPAVAETPSVYAHAAEAVAANAVADADRQEAANVGEAANSDSTEVFPAMAPG